MPLAHIAMIGCPLGDRVLKVLGLSAEPSMSRRGLPEGQAAECWVGGRSGEMASASNLEAHSGLAARTSSNST